MDVLLLLFEAARWAPSSYNAQPWKFIWGMKGDDTYPLLFDLISENNQRWAKTAPLLVLSIAETIPPGRKSVNRFAFYDTGMAVGNLLAQATYSGLSVHQMGGYDNERAKIVLNLPHAFEPAAMMAIGYIDKNGKGEAQGSQKVRERNPLETFLFNRKLRSEPGS